MSVCLSVRCIVENRSLDLDAVWVVGRLGPKMRQAVEVGDCPTRRDNLGVDMGPPFVTNGDFLACCAKVREAIELPFGVVSRVAQNIGVNLLYRGPRIPRG